ncbi:MAG: hypothetical protein GX623_08955 [Clostridiales bacterium]|nr:hypothetical protein [Clostridiales bacterium]
MPARALSSTVNAVLALLLAPLVYLVLKPALAKTGLYESIEPKTLHWPEPTA